MDDYFEKTTTAATVDNKEINHDASGVPMLGQLVEQFIEDLLMVCNLLVIISKNISNAIALKIFTIV